METEGTRAHIIAATVELLGAQGYHATSLNQILHQSATPKGSLYHHFPGGKEALAAEAVSVAGQAMTNDLDAIVMSGADFGTALSLLTSFFRERLQTSDFQKCLPLIVRRAAALSASWHNYAHLSSALVMGQCSAIWSSLIDLSPGCRHNLSCRVDT